MTYTPEIYDTASLLGTMRELEPTPDYWLSLGFPGSATFDDEYIDFSKITEVRTLAPLVVPTAQGKPMYRAAEKVFRLKPAYAKPKDPVTAAHMLRRRAGIGMGELLSPVAMSPQQRHDATVADILRQHREGLERLWEWMASQAIITGKVTLTGEAYPTTVVDFERAANHTVVKGVGTRWGDVGVSIIADIELWNDRMSNAKYGGPANRITVGTDVWTVMRKDPEIIELLKTDRRQTSGTSLDLGIGDGMRVQRKGSLSANLDLYVYSDYYELGDGTQVPFMSTKDIVMTGSNVQGVRAFGAILDADAGYASTPIFPKMWKNQDPSAIYVMNQSAPLMVPVNPNNTLQATVLA